MSRVFLTSDHHWGHRNMLLYENRPFISIEEMNEVFVRNWNEVVKKNDLVYHLGDVSMTKYGFEHTKQLNGRKILIKGNHDLLKPGVYLEVFDDIRAYKEMNNYLLSHIPVHPMQKYRYKGNIHGHLHSKRVLSEDGNVDVWYYNVSVEHTNYTPILFEEVLKRIKYERKELEDKNERS